MKFLHARSVSCLALISAIGVTGIAPAAFAQADSEKKMETVTVTATRREQTLQEVPVAVSVVSGDLLESTGTGSMDALSDLTPSLTLLKGNNESNSSVSIRGLGTSVFSQAVEPSVSIVIDDVLMARSGQGFQDLIDVQRVEVLRGPQSTLFGKNASAGVVSVTTRGPSETLTGGFDVELAEEDSSYAVRGTLSGPISDTVGFRVSAFTNDYAGHLRNVATGERANGSDSWGLRGKLQFDITDRLALTLIGDYRESDSEPVVTVRTANNPAYLAQLAPVVPGQENTALRANADSYATTEQAGLSAKAEYTFDNDFTLTSISAWRSWDFANNLDVDGLSNENPLPGGLLTFDLNSGTINLNQYTQEVRLASPDLGNFDFLIGAFAYHLDLERHFERRLELMTPGGMIAQSGQFDGSVENNYYAAFASANYYFNDQTSLFGGARLLTEEVNWVAFRDPTNVLVPGDLPLTGVQGILADFTGGVSDTAVVGNIGIRHSFNDYANAYASYSRGYKGKSTTIDFASIQGEEPVDAEESDAYEIGLKLTSPGGRWAANFAAFHTQFNNFQSQAQLPGEIATVLINAGDVSTQGVEAELMARPTDLTDISLGLAYIDATIDTFPSGPCYAGQTVADGCVNGVQDLAGKDLPYSPDLRLTFFGRQTVPLAAMPFDGFIQASGYWQDDILFSLDQSPIATGEARTMVNAAIGVEDKNGRYNASIFVNNVFDEHYVTSISQLGLFGGFTFQYVPRDHQRYVGIRFGANF
ncbi:transporter, outer membrane receptor (OMR) family [Hyphomonas neptunium ATCC 15444]|uniref:Transporter, outer membrane receptor (OMR) family n=2 Tax=Hyphomonas TaxID=85 RepID=Q0C067_HYPNA|nr:MULTISPECIES: TonB-dependent receptor [Hyphomonas]ABI77561.1 transporter, outer membrane receptor (OMR) family [Hyphomonas neptunium ATCC 15444]KCZ90541.1 outer membrane receptor (OMR) family protein [Hyphomonas hirschiana VP5]